MQVNKWRYENYGQRKVLGKRGILLSEGRGDPAPTVELTWRRRRNRSDIEMLWLAGIHLTTFVY